MATSRSQLDRVLDPSNVSVQLDTLIKAARALGKEIEIKIKRATKKEAALTARGAGRLPDFCRSELCTVVHGHALCNGRDR